MRVSHPTCTHATSLTKDVFFIYLFTVRRVDLWWKALFILISDIVFFSSNYSVVESCKMLRLSLLYFNFLLSVMLVSNCRCTVSKVVSCAPICPIVDLWHFFGLYNSNSKSPCLFYPLASYVTYSICYFIRLEPIAGFLWSFY